MQVIRATSNGTWEGWGGKEPIAVETDGETPGLYPTPKVLYVGLYTHMYVCITDGETPGLSPCLALLSRPRPLPHLSPPPPAYKPHHNLEMENISLSTQYSTVHGHST